MEMENETFTIFSFFTNLLQTLGGAAFGLFGFLGGFLGGLVVDDVDPSPNSSTYQW